MNNDLKSLSTAVSEVLDAAPFMLKSTLPLRLDFHLSCNFCFAKASRWRHGYRELRIPTNSVIFTWNIAGESSSPSSHGQAPQVSDRAQDMPLDIARGKRPFQIHVMKSNFRAGLVSSTRSTFIRHDWPRKACPNRAQPLEQIDLHCCSGHGQVLGQAPPEFDFAETGAD
eukprot:1467362-Amphidinium_carterae.1